MLGENHIPTYDPVFLKYGEMVYSQEFISSLREDIINNNNDHDLVPQEGFQESVCLNDADVLIVGGKRGSGKSFVMELAPLRFVDNPLFTVNGYRKEEDDIKRGLWNTSKKIYSNIATAKESTFRWVFPSGAVSTYEHLQNEKEIDRRFRGVEIPFIIVDEVTQISFETFFTLLASNRNSLGIKNQFIGSCNPVGPKHWLHQFISWYIDPETKEIIPERDGKTRYFYKYGKHISEIYWGNSKEEVYEKAKDKIDLIFDESLRAQGLSPLNLINSLCFIGGDYASNKIFIKYKIFNF